ncbi:MAG TPA: hypothetical protein VIV12_24140 [Streptosporangiaceae bacterium]
MALLLVLYGRMSQWGPIAKGQLLTWGRRPWRALGFKTEIYGRTHLLLSA